MCCEKRSLGQIGVRDASRKSYFTGKGDQSGDFRPFSGFSCRNSPTSGHSVRFSPYNPYNPAKPLGLSQAKARNEFSALQIGRGRLGVGWVGQLTQTQIKRRPTAPTGTQPLQPMANRANQWPTSRLYMVSAFFERAELISGLGI
mmetsp:Transcript_63502/g.113316  ORF Transcript_63502/g.113316 Transcript_63502/m.113316 type:complete len:145 (-) Transcript_63502:749-1183(-)